MCLSWYQIHLGLDLILLSPHGHLVKKGYLIFNCRREKMVQALNFARIADFPNVVGLVDGSHIPIKTPHEDGAAYRNRKGFRSINTMVGITPIFLRKKILIYMVLP